MKHSTDPSSSGGSILLRPYNLKELCALYSISSKTLKKWLLPLKKKIGKKRGNYYTIPQVREIFILLGFPTLFNEGSSNAGS